MFFSTVTRRQRNLAAVFENGYRVIVPRQKHLDKILIQKQKERVTRRQTVGRTEMFQKKNTPKSILKRRKSMAPRIALPSQLNLTPIPSTSSSQCAQSTALANEGNFLTQFESNFGYFIEFVAKFIHKE